MGFFLVIMLLHMLLFGGDAFGYAFRGHIVVVVFTLKAVPVSTQYFLTSVLVQLTRTPSVVTG